MQLIKPSFEIMACPDDQIVHFIERCGRTCYKSEDRITADSAAKFVHRLVHTLKHESVIEHSSITVRFITDRGVTHELVRHRLCAFSQESTRYVNYGKRGMVVIIPPWCEMIPEIQIDAGNIPSDLINDLSNGEWGWLKAMIEAESSYNKLLKDGWKPQQARSVLPNSLKTEIVTTANIREWRHIFRMRCASAAHPQIRELMVPLCKELQRRIPVLFDDCV
jgi:thymidylate synthase (FAD)